MENISNFQSKKSTILIIDDDPKNLAILISLLEESNFEILIAEDGESGINRAHYARPDLILLDILMPKMDGYETCIRLKSIEITKEIPVIIMTALLETEYKIKGFQAGAVDFITKPFQRDEVLARVCLHLKNRELTVMLQEEKKLLEERVAERTAELAQKNLFLEKEMVERLRLEREIVKITEEERRRISYDLHDGLCQLLIGARLQFSMLKRKMNDVTQMPEYKNISSLLEESVNLAYNLSRGLWPVEHNSSGIIPSFQDLAQRLGTSSGISIQIKKKLGCSACSNSDLTQLFRIAQEALTNSIKHSKPSVIVIELRCDQNTISLSVSDDGIGKIHEFKKGGLGLRIMNHRARLIGGSLTISDGEGGGTVVACNAPCSKYSLKDVNYDDN